ncbi:hypothetical protein [Serratia sp. (in: enterobacteria)]|uniref:hypothetical protein n=1 Tax=Serratia sp. (in: enterobacteria) TaxID=616 RepID=UPI003989E44C
MALTKAQVITFLGNKKNITPHGSIKYYTIGALKILVEKDIITVADIVAEFPELA